MACRALSYLLERLPKIEYHEVLFDFYEQLEKWAAHSNAQQDAFEIPGLHEARNRSPLYRRRQCSSNSELSKLRAMPDVDINSESRKQLAFLMF